MYVRKSLTDVLLAVDGSRHLLHRPLVYSVLQKPITFYLQEAVDTFVTSEAVSRVCCTIFLRTIAYDKGRQPINRLYG